MKEFKSVPIEVLEKRAESYAIAIVNLDTIPQRLGTDFGPARFDYITATGVAKIAQMAKFVGVKGILSANNEFRVQTLAGLIEQKDRLDRRVENDVQIQEVLELITSIKGRKRLTQEEQDLAEKTAKLELERLDEGVSSLFDPTMRRNPQRQPKRPEVQFTLPEIPSVTRMRLGSKPFMTETQRITFETASKLDLLGEGRQTSVLGVDYPGRGNNQKDKTMVEEDRNKLPKIFINEARRVVTLGERSISLETESDWNVFMLLAKNARQPVPTSMLISLIDNQSGKSKVPVGETIRRIREVLEEDQRVPKFLVTLGRSWGTKYVLDLDVEFVFDREEKEVISTRAEESNGVLDDKKPELDQVEIVDLIFSQVRSIKLILGFIGHTGNMKWEDLVQEVYRNEFKGLSNQEKPEAIKQHSFSLLQEINNFFKAKTFLEQLQPEEKTLYTNYDLIFKAITQEQVLRGLNDYELRAYMERKITYFDISRLPLIKLIEAVRNYNPQEAGSHLPENIPDLSKADVRLMIKALEHNNNQYRYPEARQLVVETYENELVKMGNNRNNAIRVRISELPERIDTIVLLFELALEYKAKGGKLPPLLDLRIKYIEQDPDLKPLTPQELGDAMKRRLEFSRVKQISSRRRLDQARANRAEDKGNSHESSRRRAAAVVVSGDLAESELDSVIGS